MSESNWPGLVKQDDPDFSNPRYQRRIVALYRLIPFVENIHEVRLSCGHEPLLLGHDPMPEVGMWVFCGDCRDEEKKRAGSSDNPAPLEK